MRNDLELYVNNKFNAFDIINMCFKRKKWGEKITLYDTPEYEIFTTMKTYDFSYKYATFELAINKKNDKGYYSIDFNIYNEREDYTLNFVNKLIKKKIIGLLEKYRKELFKEEACNKYKYNYSFEKTNTQWIEFFSIEEEVEKINNIDISDKQKENIIDDFIGRELDKYNEKNYYNKIQFYINEQLETNREKGILDLIEQIENELKELGDDEC